jgi:hypothetical protein
MPVGGAAAAVVALTCRFMPARVALGVQIHGQTTVKRALRLERWRAGDDTLVGFGLKEGPGSHDL